MSAISTILELLQLNLIHTFFLNAPIYVAYDRIRDRSRDTVTAGTVISLQVEYSVFTYLFIIIIVVDCV